MEVENCEKHPGEPFIAQRYCRICRQEAFVEMHELIEAKIADTDKDIEAGVHVLDCAEQQLKILRKRRASFENTKEQLLEKNPDLIHLLKP